MHDNQYNIFYTDDDVDDQELFVDAAHEVSKDVNIIIQHNGGELLNLLKNAHPYPDLVFLDLNMPVKNGYEVLEEIKKSEQTKDLPIVVFTTSNDDYSINMSRKLGANLYVSKPSSFTLLKNMIKQILLIDWKNFSASDEDFVYRIN